jgi:BirA family biotin operon repressor/biotin-[acetyl-CoA-carboxylase] ligase
MIRYNSIHLQQVDSTNSYLKELAGKENVDEGTVILADFQTAGKGRGQNIWLAEAGLNLTMSVLIRPSLKAGDHFMLNEILSLAAVEMLYGYGIEVKIKWPNDIYVENKKIAGILIENVLMGDEIVTSVLGIGVNVNQLQFPETLPNPVSIAKISGKSVGLSEVKEKLLMSLSTRYTALKRGNYISLHTEYCSFLYKKGETIRYKTGEKISEAILYSVAQTGELIIQQNDGRLESYLYDDVQIVI